MATIIAAYDENRVIGNKGKMPWHIPEDFKLFKEKTMGNVVIVGRKTWEGIPLLPGRRVIVISRNWAEYNKPDLPDVQYLNSLKEAMDWAEDKGEIFIAGGAQVYQQALDQDLVDKIFISKINGVHKGDTFFPELTPDWTCNLIKEYAKFNLLEFKKSKLGE
jgi:dihydrofolate reductase